MGSGPPAAGVSCQEVRAAMDGSYRSAGSRTSPPSHAPRVVPWPATGRGALLAVVALAALIVLAGCSGSTGTTFQGGARLTVEPQTIDFGTVAARTPVK